MGGAACSGGGAGSAGVGAGAADGGGESAALALAGASLAASSFEHPSRVTAIARVTHGIAQPVLFCMMSSTRLPLAESLGNGPTQGIGSAPRHTMGKARTPFQRKREGAAPGTATGSPASGGPGVSSIIPRKCRAGLSEAIAIALILQAPAPGWLFSPNGAPISVTPQKVDPEACTSSLLSSSALIEELPIAAYTFRIEGDDFVLEHVNAAGNQRNPGFAALRGKSMVSLYRDQPMVIDDARRCAREQVSVDRVLPVRRYDRTEATQFLRLTFIPAPPAHIRLFLQDVANPDVALVAMRESEARYASLIASLPDAVIVRAADGRVLFCNQLAVQLLDAKDSAELLGEVEVLAPGTRLESEVGETTPPDRFPGLQALATGCGEPERICALVGQGRKRWVRVAAQPIKNAAGDVTGSVATLTDITEKVEAERASREAAIRLDLALSAARMGVWDFEPDTGVGWWSPYLDDVFRIGGRPRGLQSFMAQVHTEDRERVLGELERLIRDSGSCEIEFRILGKDGLTRWTRVRGQILPRNGRICISGTAIDITDQRRLEDELRRAARLESIGMLAGGIAHDFNNLLAAMLGSLELVEDQCPPATREDLEAIRHSALRARDLTRQLLAFARKQPATWTTVELNSLVKRVELILRRLVQPTVEIVISTSEPVHVRADASLLEQVLVNLVINGRDAMPNGGKLTITVERHKKPSTRAASADSARLIVADSGVGMDQAMLDRVFDPFFTTKAHGTGLGLSSSYGIIKQHQGEITVESTPGRGSTFAVTLPCVPPTTTEQATSITPLVAPNAKGVVLVVDDDATVRQMAVRLVKSLGYRALSAGSGAEARECFANSEESIGMLLCDVIMPGEDGPTLAASLLRTRPDLRVVFMSGYPFDVRDKRLQDAPHLQKPFSRADLAKKLSED